MLFQKRTDFSPVQTFTIGQTLQFPITREFHVESIIVRVQFTVGTAMTTDNPDMIQNIVNKIQLQVSDGARTRNVIDVSGPGLLDYAQQVIGGLDRNTASRMNTDPAAAQVVVLYYPIFCSHPQLDDPVGSTLLLPFPRYNSNPVLTVQIATQAQMDAGAGFAFTSGTCSIIVNRRQVNKANWPTLDWELSEVTVPYAATGNSQLYELQIPGSYTGIMLRDYSAATGPRAAFIETAGGENKLQLLGTVLRRFRCADIQAENDLSIRLYGATWLNVTANAYLDFISDKTGESGPDLGSVLDANILSASGARLQLLQDITGGANIFRKYLTHRIFGNLQALKFSGGR